MNAQTLFQCHRAPLKPSSAVIAVGVSESAEETRGGYTPVLPDGQLPWTLWRRAPWLLRTPDR